jgi:hypothetical protein
LSGHHRPFCPFCAVKPEAGEEKLRFCLSRFGFFRLFPVSAGFYIC